MVFDKFLICLRFICKAYRSTRISMCKVTGERVKDIFLSDSDKVQKSTRKLSEAQFHSLIKEILH